MPFRFKQFTVSNTLSAMKVNTDGVLLGAAMTLLPTDTKLLDIGTGTGTTALMAAQRLSSINPLYSSNCKIYGIDIDADSASEASLNFSRSPWKGNLIAAHCSLEQYQTSSDINLIFSNPPYYDCSLLSSGERKSTARHTLSLSYREILDFSAEKLSPQGRVSMILPADVEQNLCRYARMCRLFPFRIVRIRTVRRKNPSRIIAEFSRVRCENVQEQLLTIQNEGNYTQEYVSLTKDFYLNF